MKTSRKHKDPKLSHHSCSQIFYFIHSVQHTHGALPPSDQSNKHRGGNGESDCLSCFFTSLYGRCSFCVAMQGTELGWRCMKTVTQKQSATEPINQPTNLHDHKKASTGTGEAASMRNWQWRVRPLLSVAVYSGLRFTVSQW